MANSFSNLAEVFDWTYPLAFLWGLLILASFAGWGWSIGHWLVPEKNGREIGWAFAATIGMATFLILSGPLMMLSIFSVIFVVLFFICGWGLLAWRFRVTRGAEERWMEPPTSFLNVSLIGLAFFIFFAYAGAVATRWYNQNDDFAAYFYLVKKLLDTGTLFDPFSFRMLGALGGQLVLLTPTLAFLPWKYAHLMDFGMATLIIMGFAWNLVRGYNARAWTARIILLALALAVPLPRSNTGSESTGTIFFIALLYALEWASTQRIKGWRTALIIGGLMAATATLRCHNIFMLGLLGAGFVANRLWKENHDRSEILLQALKIVLMTIVFLTPWWIVSYRSGGTFLYPLFRGNQQPQFEVYNYHPPVWEVVRFVVGFFLTTNYIFLLLPVCFVAAGREQRSSLVYGGSIFLLTITFVSQFTSGQTLYYHACRYLEPIALAFALYTSGIVARQQAGAESIGGQRFPSFRSKLAWATAMVIVLLQLPGFTMARLSDTIHIYQAIDIRSEKPDFRLGVGPLSTDEARHEYAEAFARIPLHAKTLIALDYPFLLDNEKHAIFSIDIPGAASPPPGFPSFQGPEPVEKYLRSQGFRYIAHVPFDQSLLLYGRKSIMQTIKSPEPYSVVFGKFELDFLENINHIAQTNLIIYDSPTIRVIALKE